MRIEEMSNPNIPRVFEFADEDLWPTPKLIERYESLERDIPFMTAGGHFLKELKREMTHIENELRGRA